MRLAKAYSDSLRALITAISLKFSMGEAFSDTETLRQSAEAAREALEHHRAGHGC